MTAKVSWSVNGGQVHSETRELGNIPIMVRVSIKIPNFMFSFTAP